MPKINDVSDIYTSYFAVPTAKAALEVLVKFLQTQPEGVPISVREIVVAVGKNPADSKDLLNVNFQLSALVKHDLGATAEGLKALEFTPSAKTECIEENKGQEFDPDESELKYCMRAFDPIRLSNGFYTKTPHFDAVVQHILSQI